MAKTSVQIYCNYLSAKAQANELEEIANDIIKLSDEQLSNEFMYVYLQWTGEASKSYQNRGRILRTQIKDHANELKKAASTIRRVAERVYKTEMEALRIARERKYKG